MGKRKASAIQESNNVVGTEIEQRPSNAALNTVEDGEAPSIKGRSDAEAKDGSDLEHIDKPTYMEGVDRIKCPYLDTVNRQVIDFDSEKLCSITLTNMNVYVCLVCGKYFQGRGKSTPAFTHSVQAGHFVYMNLHSGRAYCLPDGYEVIDSSLEDVRRCLSPQYTLRSISALSTNTSLARDVYGVSYLPGFVGLNNLSRTDYINALLHALAHVTPFRDFWLQERNYSFSKSNLVHQFGLTIRKMWSARNFKSTVSPQELAQELSVLSQKRFSLGQRSECLELFGWLLGALHRGLGKSALAPAPAPAPAAIPRGQLPTPTTIAGNSHSSSNNNDSGNGNTTNSGNNIAQTKRMAPSSSAGRTYTSASTSTSVVYEPFQGIVRVTSYTKRLVNSMEEAALLPDNENRDGDGGLDESKKRSRAEEEAEEEAEEYSAENGWVRSVTEVAFNYLSLEIPPCPLFRDSEGGLVIPQVPLFQLLAKFDGRTWTDHMTGEAHVRRRYQIVRLPRYLVLHLVRFNRNNFYLEKNPTIVTFPVRNLEMKEFLVRPSSVDDKEEKKSIATTNATDAAATTTTSALRTTSTTRATTSTSSTSSTKAASSLGQRAEKEATRMRSVLRSACPAAAAAAAAAGSRASDTSAAGAGAGAGASASDTGAGMEPPLPNFANLSNNALRRLISSIGSELQKIQAQSVGTPSDRQKVTTKAAGAEVEVQEEEEEKLDLVHLAEAAAERVRLLDVSKYDLLANICHNSPATNSKGSVAIGDVNMQLGGGGGGASGSKSSASASASAVKAMSASARGGSEAHSAAEHAHSNAHHTSTAAAGSSNRVLNEGTYKVHVQHRGTSTGQWFEIQDLHVAEISPQLIGVSESNILIYEKKGTVATVPPPPPPPPVAAASAGLTGDVN